MKSHAALISKRPGGIRLIAALLLLAVPLAVAAWGLGGYSAQRERNNPDATPTPSLTRASVRFRKLVSTADSAATRRAISPRVQRELRHASSHVLIWSMLPTRKHPLRRWRRSLPAAAAVRRVDVVSKGGTVGQVVVFLPLDHQLVGWLTGGLPLGAHPKIGIAQGGSVVEAEGTLPIESGAVVRGVGDIRAGGLRYRS